MLAPVRTVAPATDPVTIQQAKAHLRVTSDAENTLIAALVSAAVSHLDGWSGILGRCLITQTWRQDFSGFGCMRLPFPNVASAVVAYTDENGTSQTLAGSNYHIVSAVGGTQIILADGGSFPGTASQPDAVRVTFVAGYGIADNVPAGLKAAILLHVGHLFESRAAVEVGASPAILPLAYDALVAPHRVIGL